MNGIWKDFDKFFVGFDDHFARMNKSYAEMTKNVATYPPYNVKKIDDNHFVIEMAVAGFTQNDIEIEMDGDKLYVRGNIKADDSNETLLWQGIANRAFTRWFTLEDHVEVKDAELLNGMLKIALERLVPEEKKPKKIAIKSKGQPQFLTEGEQDAISERL